MSGPLLWRAGPKRKRSPQPASRAVIGARHRHDLHRGRHRHDLHRDRHRRDLHRDRHRQSDLHRGHRQGHHRGRRDNHPRIRNRTTAREDPSSKANRRNSRSWVPDRRTPTRAEHRLTPPHHKWARTGGRCYLPVPPGIGSWRVAAPRAWPSPPDRTRLAPSNKESRMRSSGTSCRSSL